jgi:uncharacterized protein DUF5808
MSTHDETDPPEPEGRLAGLPYDLRRPTVARIRARAWNPDDPRVLTPKTFGWGYGLNFYWLAHPFRLVRARRAGRTDGTRKSD